jgi:AraC-like DNA-binding protein
MVYNPGSYGTAPNEWRVLQSRGLGQLTVTHAEFPPLFRESCHSHERPRVTILLQGSHREKIGREEHDRTGVAYLHAQVEHSIVAGIRGFSSLTVDFPDGLMPAGDRLVASSEARTGAQRLARELKHDDPASKMICEGLAITLLGDLLRTSSSSEVRPPRWLSRVKEILAEAEGDLSISALANSAGVHPGHLTASFTKFYGTSPGVFLRAQRLERAEAMLRRTDAPIGEIAATCGYADASHFSRAFRAAKGLPPSIYRNGHKP